MNRQYVGARYVPKFSDVNGGVWDSSYSYEPLTIVKHGIDFYTSKIPVPVGVDITDDRYWVLTGNYNGAITELQQAIDELTNKIDSTWYNTVADMVADTDLTSGVVYVKSYYADPVGGGGTYEIISSGKTYDIELDNGKYARLLHNGSVTVEQFGGLADNDTDNSPIIQKADDYCADNASILLFSGCGYYKCNSTINKSIYTLWSGTASGTETNNSTNLRATLVYTGSSTFISIATTESGNEYGEYSGIKNLRIQGVQPYNSGSRGIVLTGSVRQMVYENLQIRFFNTGMYLTGGEHMMRNVIVWYCKYCVNCSGVADSIFENCLFGSGTDIHTSVGGGFGIQLVNSRNITFVSCRLQHAMSGNGGVFNNVTNIIFNGCVIDGNENIGIQLVNCNGCSIVGCEFHDNDRHIYVLGNSGTAENIIIGDNVFIHYDGSGSTGIVLTLGTGGTVQGVNIHDCAFYQIQTPLDKHSSITTNINIHDNIGLSV